MQPVALSIRQYALIVIAITAGIFVGFGAMLIVEFNAVQQDIENTRQEEATKELRGAIQKTLEHMDATLSRLLEWDEVSQNIQDPAYFAYWYNHRLKTAANLPPEMADIMLYTLKGTALAELIDSQMPGEIDPSYLSPALQVVNGHDLIMVGPVWAGTSGQPLGYLATQTRFLELLTRLSHLAYVDENTLGFNAKSLKHIPREQLLSQINYQVKPTPELAELQQSLRHSLINLGIIVIVPTLLSYGLLGLLLGRPIRGIADYIDCLDRADSCPRNRSSGAWLRILELEKIRYRLSVYHANLTQANRSLKETHQQLWTLEHHDPLTGVLNRHAFDEQWRALDHLLTDRHLPVSFMLIDIQHFKAINDTYGHVMGDRVLKEVARQLSLALRKGEQLFRLGGNEFGAILIDCDRSSSRMIAERCMHIVERIAPDTLDMREPVRISIGISQTCGGTVDAFLNLQWQADAALHQAKKPGNPNILIYDDSMSESARGLLSNRVSEAVYQAIDNGEGIVMYYQPIVELATRRTCYYEALVRLQRDGEIIPPCHIFSVIEARRLETEMDQAIIRQVLRDLASGKIPEATGLSLNLSGSSVMRPEIVQWLQPFQAWTESYTIIVEVTETLFIHQLDQATEHLRQLQVLGLQVALDDFGSGFSAFRYLATMPVDIVKFDISLLRGLQHPNQRQIIEDLAGMIHRAGYRIVAEGLETEEMTLQSLQVGFHYGQGYHLGRPQLHPAPPIMEPLPSNVPASVRKTLLH